MSGALEIAGRALELAGGDWAEVVVSSERSGFVRFAHSEVHQPTFVDDVEVQLTVATGGRVGVAATNRVDDDALRALARRASTAAASAAPDPLRPAPPGAAAYPTVEGADPETAALGPEEQARLASRAIDAAEGFDLFGYFTSAACELAVASSSGVRACERSTDAAVLALASGDDASGFADGISRRVADLDPAAVAREACEKAARTRGARDAAPGVYRAVLEPFAVSSLVRYFGDDAFNGLAFLEGRSFLAGRLGERVFDPRLSIAEDPLSPLQLPRSFDVEGVPKERVPLVEEGRAAGVLWDTRSAARAGAGHRSTGSAQPAPARSIGAIPTALTVAAGEAGSTDELAELIGDGIYVTRVHYVGVVDERAGILTGMTRDGTFRIRGGRVAEPLVNLRFTIAVPELLAELPGLTRARRLVNEAEYYDDRLPLAVLAPALATTRFTVTGSGSRPGL